MVKNEKTYYLVVSYSNAGSSSDLLFSPEEKNIQFWEEYLFVSFILNFVISLMDRYDEKQLAINKRE